MTPARLFALAALVGLFALAGCGRQEPTSVEVRTSTAESSHQANPEGRTRPLSDQELGK